MDSPRPDAGHARAAALVAAARALLGARFRHGGRAPDGVDCVGVALAAAAGAGLPIDEPPPYAPRATRAEDVDRWLRARGFRPVPAPLPGDLLWCAAGTSHHLAVAAPGGFVEASASLRRVVERPGPPPHPCTAWRFPEQQED